MSGPDLGDGHLSPPFRPPPPPAPAPAWATLPTAMQASVGQRVGAGLIDMVPLVFLALAMGDRTTGSGQFIISIQGWRALWWLLAAIAYYLVSELVTSTSPGKAALGLWVRDKTTGPPSQRQILIRNAMRAIDIFPCMYLLGLTTTAISSGNQRLGDMAARTMVAQRPAGEPKPAQASVLSLAAVVIATFGIGIALLALVDNSAKVGDFDVQAEVTPYAEQIIEEGFRPVSAVGLRTHLVHNLIDDEELNSFIDSMLDRAGQLTNDYEIVDYQLVETQIGPDQRVESASLLIRAEFEKRSGRLVLTISDVDGELRLIGLHFDA